VITFNNIGLNKTMLTFGSLSTSVKGASAISNLEEANFPASGLVFEDRSKPWVTTSLIAVNEVVVTLNLGALRDTIFYEIGLNNSIVPYSLLWWTGDPTGGGMLEDEVNDIDPILRTDQMSMPPHAQNLVDEKLLRSPYRRSSSINHDYLQIKFDTSGGNGNFDFLQVGYIQVFKSVFSPRGGIKSDTKATANTLSKFKYTSDRRGTSTERFPYRDLPVDLTFLSTDESDVYSSDYLCSRARHARVTAWRDAFLIDSWHLHSVSGYGSETSGISLRGDGSTKSATGLTVGEAR